MMRNKGILLGMSMLALSLPCQGCHVYYGIAKSGNQIYLAGATSFLMFTSTWVKRCQELDEGLICRDLDVTHGDRTAVSSNAGAVQDEAALERRRQLLRKQLEAAGRSAAPVKTPPPPVSRPAAPTVP